MSVKNYIWVFLLGAVTAYAVSINAGLGFTDNGPCTPKIGQVGFCNDSGVPAVYDDSGTLYHLPVAGPQGIPGIQGIPGKDGDKGPQGVPGTSMPNPVTLTCNPGKGTIQGGAKMQCAWSQ
jgi:hypothetical protein